MNCKHSLLPGIVAYPLSVIAYSVFFLACLCRVPEVKQNYFIASIVMYCIVAALAVTSIVFGIIGIKQQSAKKGMAVAGIIVSSLKILFSVLFVIFSSCLFDVMIII